MEPEIGSILEGKVTTITKFGAFIALENGKSGLVHISEIANCFVNDVHDFLQEGTAVRVKVLSNDNGKINLSIKKALPEQPAFHAPQRPGDTNACPAQPIHRFARTGSPQVTSGEPTFEDKLKLFMTSSEGRMADLNRNREAKRGGGGKRHK